MNIKSILNVFSDVFGKIRKSWELHKYDRFTIAEYFRKQGAQVGENCSIIPTSIGSEPYLVKIGNHVTIATDVKFVTHDGGVWLFRDEMPNIHVFGTIIIEDNCVIGRGAILMPNIKIGSNSIVASGSVVINDIPPNSIAIGVPARVLASVQKYKEKCLTRWEEQKLPDSFFETGLNLWDPKQNKEYRKNLKEHLIKVFWKENYKP
ncbi:acyltransferase [candidate division KSB1 bacterium]|nr:acyltransferase [candidate division KSB1 bacterium]